MASPSKRVKTAWDIIYNKNKDFFRHGTMLETFDTDEVNVMLRDESLTDEEIWDVIDLADQEAWENICKNITKFPARVQNYVSPGHTFPRKKRRLNDLTDEIMEDMEKERNAEKIREFEAHWETIKKTIPERPIDSLDDEYDDAWNALSAARDRMTAYVAKKKGKYLPPSMREAMDVEQKEIDDEIRECKREYEKIEKRICAADEEYMSKKKDELLKEWLLTM